GHTSWPEDAWRRINGVNNWVGMSVDQRRGLVFAPIASAKDMAGGFYGGRRLGDNLYSSSIVALDAATGHLRWSRQLVRHDLWDYDAGPQPTLVQVRWRGQLWDAIAQPTKMGYLYLLDRDTGRPLQPMKVLRTPPSDVPGERAARTQVVPAWPLPFTRQRLGPDDLTRRTPQARAAALAEFSRLRHRGMFEPPSLQGTVVFPGFGGGAAWGGAAYDPGLGYLFINSNEIAWIVQLGALKPGADGQPAYWLKQFRRFLDAQGYPATSPPWGRLSAIDLRTGRYVWSQPFGDYPDLAGRQPSAGSENYGGGVATASGLLFIGASIWDNRFRAFDSRSGKLLWSATLEAAANATPAVYVVDGVQFVVVAAGGGKSPLSPPASKYVAFS
ncbi:MAG: PQQ-binding-like beta-propeller repeat protein, partial [bacterium]